MKGKALLVGLRSVNPDFYNGWTGVNGCSGCELDVDNMEGILAPLTYEIDILKTEEATKENILAGLNIAAEELKAGDIFVYYFSGHGGQQTDEDGDEMDGHDETQCAYNGALIDDQLNEVWLKFKSGVRIVTISDSCNSGTVYRNARSKGTKKLAYATPMIPITDLQVGTAMKAKLIHFGGCRDGSTSSGFPTGGAFTLALCRAWNNGTFEGNYNDFYDAICGEITTSQQPQYAQYGSGVESFRDQKPFTIFSIIQPPFQPYEYEITIPVWLVHLLEGWATNNRMSSSESAIPQVATKSDKVVVRVKHI